MNIQELNGRPLRLLIGGSPCTYWSIAQKNNRETEAEGLGWELFKNYLIAKDKFKPDFFLYENNKSAAQAIKEQISRELSVDLQYINSSLVSAQNRQRFYAHNIPGVQQPEDRKIYLIDIIESGATWLEKSYALTTRCSGVIISDTLKRHRHTMIAEPVCVAQRGRYDKEGKIVQHYEPRTDGKTNVITTVTKDNLVAEPVRIGDIGSTAQAHRVYSCYGKSVTINSGGGGQGGKTGLYIAPVFPFEVDDKNKSHCIDVNYYKGSNPKQTLEKHRRTMVAELTDFDLSEFSNVIVHESGNIEIDGKLIYCIKDGYIWCKNEKYEINLPDGYYTIRKLTVTECERLQTLPDGYTAFGLNTIINKKGDDNTSEANVEYKDVITKSQIEKANCAINTILDYKETEQQNSKESLLTMIKNVKLKAVKDNKKQMKVSVSCTIKDGKERELRNLLKKIDQNANIVMNMHWQMDYVQDIIKCNDSIMTHYMPMENENFHRLEGIIDMENNHYTELSWKRLLEESSKKKNEYTILTLISWITQKIISTSVKAPMSIQASIINLMMSQDNLLKWDISFLKMENIVSISDSTRYKQLGNGWTAEVIIHILSYINIPKNYPIEVLSMYDGIATGRYCLEKLGYTNITYKSYEIDKYAIKVALKNYPDIIECGDAFQLREDGWEY